MAPIVPLAHSFILVQSLVRSLARSLARSPARPLARPPERAGGLLGWIVVRAAACSCLLCALTEYIVWPQIGYPSPYRILIGVLHLFLLSVIVVAAIAAIATIATAATVVIIVGIVVGILVFTVAVYSFFYILSMNFAFLFLYLERLFQ
jgi:hypothetical protein